MEETKKCAFRAWSDNIKFWNRHLCVLCSYPQTVASSKAVVIEDGDKHTSAPFACINCCEHVVLGFGNWADPRQKQDAIGILDMHYHQNEAGTHMTGRDVPKQSKTRWSTPEVWAPTIQAWQSFLDLLQRKELKLGTTHIPLFERVPLEKGDASIPKLGDYRPNDRLSALIHAGTPRLMQSPCLWTYTVKGANAWRS